MAVVAESAPKQQSAAPKTQAEAPKTEAEAAPAYDYAAAIAKHTRNVQRLDTLIKAGVSDAKKGQEDPDFGIAWPNSAQWIGEAKKTNLHALTRTHDSDARAKDTGHDAAKEVAYFGSDTPVPKTSSYARKNTKSSANISFNSKTTLGFRRAGMIAIMEPEDKSEKSIKQTLVHEVQHDSDRHEMVPLERYKSEMRAYWLGKTFEKKDAASGTGTKGAKFDGHTIDFDNARQEAIFRHLYKGYAYVAKAWKKEKSFRAEVTKYRRPESINWENSPRVDDLYAELQKSKPSASRIKKLAAKLTDEDKKAIKGTRMRATWRTMIQEKAKSRVLDKGDLAALADGLDWPYLKTLAPK